MTKQFWDKVLGRQTDSEQASSSDAPIPALAGARDVAPQPAQTGGRSLYVPGAKVDIVFTIDTTGSMSDKIEGLLQTAEKFVNELATLGLDYRIAVVAFGDIRVPGDKIVQTAFTNDVATTKKSLNNIPRYSGGGNEGESSLEALQKALALPFRADAAKVLLLITDESADQREIKASEIIRRLKAGQFLTFTVTPRHDYYLKMASETGGKWYKIGRNTDFTELLKLFRHIAQQVSQTVAEGYLLQAGGGNNPVINLPPTG